VDGEATPQDNAGAPPAPAPAPKSEQVQERIEAETHDPSDMEDAVEGAVQVDHRERSARQQDNASFSPTKAPTAARNEKVLASPAVRKRARDLGVDLTKVKLAEDGRVRHGDLDAFLSYTTGYGTAAAERRDETIKVVGLRRRIAENMAASKRHISRFFRC
jgi:2-oxoisovalerate dehydrogenase E2 component (dihydrolipoyl transacylase)